MNELSRRWLGGLNGEIIRFLLVGGVAALVDLAVYLLLVYAGLPSSMAKLISFVLVGMLAYLAHKTITFQAEVTRPHVSVPLFLALYALTLGLNVMANEYLLAVLPFEPVWTTGGAWFGATALSASVNFLGGKLVIFRE